MYTFTPSKKPDFLTIAKDVNTIKKKHSSKDLLISHQESVYFTLESMAIDGQAYLGP
jgi:hypothetical protein